MPFDTVSQNYGCMILASQIVFKENVGTIMKMMRMSLSKAKSLILADRSLT